MQWQLAGNRTAAPVHPAAALALCVLVLCATRAGAQLSIGPIRVAVSSDARKILTAARAAERVASRVPTRSAARVVPTAERYLGVPYRWGGTSPKTGFDCSGFVRYVFARHGTRLPRTSREQASSGQRLRPVWSALRAGDLVMFAEPGRRISHVAIYAGRGRIIHASGSGRRVRYDALDTKRGKWFARHIVAARRVSPTGASIVRELLTQQSRESVPLLQLDPPDRAPAPE